LASTVTAQSLIAQIRARANSQGEDASTPDSELLNYINASLFEWYEIIVQTQWGGEWYVSSATSTTTANVSTLALPTDCLQVLSVDVILNGSPQTATRIQRAQRNVFRGATPYAITWGRSPIFYRVTGANIELFPTPDGSTSVTIAYTPTAPQLTSSQDVLTTQHGWEEWIILDGAIKLLTKQGQLDIIPVLGQEKASQKQRIIEAVMSRDLNQAAYVNEVETYGEPYDY
jgi:hypothetical protein